MKLAEKNCCTGCGACANACKNNCIEMKPDGEGFPYPHIDFEKCVGCNNCIDKCPVLNVDKNSIFTIKKAYIVQNRDRDVLFKSTSGGFFSAIAKYVISENGVVYGAAFNENFEVFHIGVDSINGVERLRKSKYVQSNMNFVFQEISEKLSKGTLVCFSGTPCQNSALALYLGKKPDNLLLVDFVCHGVASPLVWNNYLEKMNKSAIKSVYFRDKAKGYHYGQLKLNYNNGNDYCAGTEYDPMLRAYFSNNCIRPSCYSCMFKGEDRVSDFTMWDCFDLPDKSVIDDDLGVSKVVLRTELAQEIFDCIADQLIFIEKNPVDLVNSSKEMTKSVKQGALRNDFMKLSSENDGKDAFDIFFPINLRCHILRILRIILYRLGIYSAVRKKYNVIKSYIKGRL